MKRIEWIDSLKGFGSICVVLGHLGCNPLIYKYIYSFHMPLFFALSGFLYNNYGGDYRLYITKKTKSLLIPFLFWNIASFLGGLLQSRPIIESIKKFFVLGGDVCWNVPIWFLLMLYMVEIVFFFIETYIPYGKYVMIPVLFVMGIVGTEKWFLLKLNILPVCLLFFIFGHIYRSWYDRHSMENKEKKYSFLPAVLFGGISIIFGVFLNGSVSLYSALYGNIIYFIVAAVSGILFFTIVFQKIHFFKYSKVLVYLGKNSLIIMATQYWFFYLYDVVSHRLWGMSIWHYRNTAVAVGLTIVTVLFICGIVEGLKKVTYGNNVLKKICIWSGIHMA